MGNIWKPIKSAPVSENRKSARGFLAGTNGHWPVACHAIKRKGRVQYFVLGTDRELSWMPTCWCKLIEVPQSK